ncbi:MAG: hypothetical protein CBE10_02585 [bacterium TMED250]|nr:MAG: hypothetical protein CBE10_02585 [bacterium TMED250]|tara:strand:- start:7943 stop:8818 length:876 start_codon:yes stop_codon:yes gene_type:complete
MLSKTIKEYFDRCVRSEYPGQSKEHPIIILNALKNIIGDNRKEYSKKLLELMERISLEFPEREDDQSILDKVAKEGLGLTVFVSELEDACQSGIPEKIEKEAARMQWVSDNGLGGFEALVEVALQDFERLGAFSFHLFRSNIFNRNINETWPYTRCLVKEISKNPLLEPHRKENTSCTFKIGSIRSQTVNFTSAHRFWNGEYVRSGGYKREISFWIKNQYYQSEMNIEKNIKKEITFYFNNGGNFFIDVAEDLINKKNDIIYLESLRYLSKQNKDFHGFISSEISKLIKDN